MADYFVKTDGSDGSNGTTWALAKATIQAGLNLCTVAGDRCIVAPGVYPERNITPPSAGTSGSHKKIIGDYAETYMDGGSQTHGKGVGYVVIDSSLTTGNKGFHTTQKTLADSSAWAFWDWEGLYCTGGMGSGYGVAASVANYGTSIKDCIFVGTETPLLIYGWDISPDTYSSIVVDNCVMVGYRQHATLPRYNNGFQYSVWPTNSVAFPTNPHVLLRRCFIAAHHAAACNDAALAAQYSYIKLQNCTLYALQAAYASAFAIQGQSASFAKVDTEDCLLFGYGARNLVTGTDTRAQSYYSGGNAASLDKFPHLPTIAYLYPTSPLVDVNGANGVFPDIFGIAKQGNADYGMQELLSGQYPLPPNMDISNLQTGGGGSGCPVVGGSIVRRA
jgi:hypothetical protein